MPSRAIPSLTPPVALAGLVAGLALTCVVSASIGAVALSPGQVASILLARVGLADGLPMFTQQQEAVLLAIRLPRVALGALVGAGLATAGAAMQAVFRNPLADPSLVGVSSGASLAAIAAIVFGISWFGPWTLPIVAFLGGLLATLGLYRFARRGGRTEVITLLLAGLALNALLGAVVGLLIQRATDPQLRTIVFWTLGSLGSATWVSVIGAAPFVLVATLGVQQLARPLNLLALGEAEARHLGLDTERVKLVAVVGAALATGAAVAVSGIVGFVGLMAPHLVRLTLGPDHRLLLPASALVGAMLLVIADLAARTFFAPAELSLGVVLGLVGAPFFFFLVERTRRSQGGWA